MKLSNEILEIFFDEKKSLYNILDKRIGKRYLTRDEFSNLFRVFSPKGNWQGRHGDSKSQPQVAVKKISGEKAVLKWEGIYFEKRKIKFGFNISDTDYNPFDKDKMEFERIDCKITIALHGEEIHMEMEVENKGDNIVTDVMFPIVSGFGEESADMDIVWPVQTQINKRIVEKPFCNLGGKNHKEWFHERRYLQARYPMELASAWADFSDEKGGVSFDIRSDEPQLFDFGIQKVILKADDVPAKNITGLFMTQQYYPTIKPGGKWRSPLCILRVHNEDWHKTAKLHREYLENVMERPSTPKKFVQSTGWHFYLMKLQDGTEVRDFDDLEEMAKASKQAGMDYIMLFGLYHNGHDNDYEMSYIPNRDWGGPRAFKEAVRKVKKTGVEVIPFFNGTLMDSRLLEDDPKLLDMCVLGRTGARYGGQDWSRPTFDFPHNSYKGYTTTRNNMNFEVCMTGKQGFEWVTKTVERLSREYETGHIQLDQLAHKAYVCYDENHGHKSPQDAYTKDLKKLMEHIRTKLRECNPEGIVIGEGFSDLTASYCDGFWNWNQTDNPQVCRYAVPWMKFSCQVDALDYDRANLSFVHGVLLDLKIEGGVGTVSDFPLFALHLKKLSELKKTLYDSYATGDFEDEDGFFLSGDESVIAKIHVNPGSGKAAVIVANLSGSEAFCSIKFEYGINPVKKVLFDGAKEDFKPKEKIKLGPYEVMGIECSV